MRGQSQQQSYPLVGLGASKAHHGEMNVLDFEIESGPRPIQSEAGSCRLGLLGEDWWVLQGQTGT